MLIKKNLSKLLISSLLLIILFSSITVLAKENYPNPTNYKYVNDYTNTLSEFEIKNIISIGKELEDKTSAQAVIVLINSTNDIPIETYALNLFRTWGIGEKDKDNGLLILLAVSDRKWRVEVGRGLEGPIPDALSNRVMTTLGKPKFIAGDYGLGLLECYSSFSDLIAKEYNVTLTKSLNIQLPNEPNSTNSTNDGNIFVAGGIFTLLFLMDLFLNRGRISRVILQLMFLSNFNRRNGPRGGSGGGFGGFGGGSSNGGGSSGGW